MVKPVLIAGPTASGKSSLALAIAEMCGGVIVNADSAQVYRELEVLTARPGPKDLARAPHRLFGHVSGATAYSTGAWLDDAKAELGVLRAAGERAIIVGGTGLYFHALLNGLTDIPPIDDEVRAHWRAEGARLDAAALYSILVEKDPLMARELNPNDRQRVVRALEVREGTGRSLKLWQEDTGPGLLRLEDTVPFVLSLERDALYQRINERFGLMVQGGALEEVRALKAAGLPDDLPIMRALGVPELMQYIDGAIDLPAATELAAQQTRRYAKRQLTWLRRNMIAWNEVFAQYMERNIADIFSKIHKNG